MSSELFRKYIDIIITESASLPPGYKIGQRLLDPNGMEVIFTNDPYEEYIIRRYKNGVHQPKHDFATDDYNEVMEILRGNRKLS